MSRLPPPASEPVVRHPLSLVELGQQFTESVLPQLRLRTGLLLRSLPGQVILAPQLPPRQAQRPVRDPAVHEGEGIHRQNLTARAKITQPLVRETLQQRVECQSQRRYFECHVRQHRPKIRGALRPLTADAKRNNLTLAGSASVRGVLAFGLVLRTSHAPLLRLATPTGKKGKSAQGKNYGLRHRPPRSA